MDEQTVKQGQDIAELQKHQAVLDVKLDNIRQGITEIKTNHLVHINDTMMETNRSIATLATSFTAQVADLRKTITDLVVTDAKREPAFNLGSEIIRSVIMAVIAGLMFILIKK